MNGKSIAWLGVVAVVLSILSIWLGCRLCGGGAGPLPIIIVTPEPSDPSNPASNHWKIDGAAAQPKAEAGLKLNRVAFLQKVLFEATVSDGSGGYQLVNPHKLTASFKHCSVTKTAQCHACPLGETCVTSDLELLADAQLGSDFRWYLDSTELSPKSYATYQDWRAELCGDLDGPITAFWRENNVEKSDVVPAGQVVRIRAK